MTDLFTVEEINLICIFDTQDFNRLKSELVEMIADLSDSELIEIAQTALSKLSKMSDIDFAALELYPEYNDGEEMEVKYGD
jgi:hypothetical protein